MRRAGLLLALVTILASSASPAAAHRFPDTCTSNNAELVLARDTPIVRNGDAQTYRIYASNSGTAPCHVSNAGVTLRLPSAAGAPGATPITLVSGEELPPQTPQFEIAAVPYTVAVNAGVPNAVAEATATGTVHDSPADTQATITKTIGTQVTWPALSLAFTANPATGIVPLNVRFDYLLTNTSRTDVPMSNVQVDSAACAAGPRVSGDTDSDGLLDTGEAWLYSCSRLFTTATTYGATALGSATSTVDTRTVTSPQDPAAVAALAPSLPAMTLTRSVSPTGGIAPLSAAHTYTVRNTSAADARPIADVTIDDPTCMSVTRTQGDDLLERDETWTFTCPVFLPTAQTILGTALARGFDTYERRPVNSNEAGFELTASLPAPGTATPTPTPTPDEPVDPAATPTQTPTSTKPSTRVNLATTSGRLARPCGQTATAQLKVGKRLIASKRIRLDSRCRYRVRFANVTRSRLRGATRVSVTVRSGRRTATHRVSVPKR